MPKLFVDITTEIQAPARAVWTVLTTHAYTDRWAQTFSAGEFAHLHSDWQLGSPVHWLNPLKELCVDGKVTAREDEKLLRYTVFDARAEHGERALVTEEDGITYELSEHDGVTTLHLLQGDFGVMENGEKYRDMTIESWNKALPVIRQLAEREANLEKYEGARDWVMKLEKEGYQNVQVCDVGKPDMEFGVHTHEQHTVHVLLLGDLTLIEGSQKEMLHQGDRFEIPAGTTHNALCGAQGCVFVVGVKV